MNFSETKKVIFSLVLLIFTVFVLPQISQGIDFSSGSFRVKDPILSEGAKSSASLNFGLGQSIGQVAIGRSTSSSFQLWSGFQYFFRVDPNVLTATPDDAEVDLSWTVPQVFLGMTIDNYEVGTGTTSGSYTFENVGLVTNFTKTGLSNGTPYYFIVKALGPGGVFLVFSNEATATPNGVVIPPPPPPPSGGGGGGPVIGTANIIFKGFAYPNSLVTVLRDGFLATTTIATASGEFTANANSLSSGSYSFSVYATDPDGHNSPSLDFLRTLIAGTTTTVENLVVGPTINLSHTSIKQTESLTVFGYATPNSEVALSLTGQQTLDFNVTSAANGYYVFIINTDNLARGDYTARTQSRFGNSVSEVSRGVNFEVSDETVVVPPDPECNRSDLNCDGRVNLVDFSILLYFWDMTEFSKNPRVDIDKSGRVDLRDLSIMLYDWTG